MIKKYKILIICGNLIKHKYFAIKLLKNFKNSNVIFENYPKNISNNYTLHKSKIITNHFKKVQFYEKIFQKILWNQNFLRRKQYLVFKKAKLTVKKY